MNRFIRFWEIFQVKDFLYVNCINQRTWAPIKIFQEENIWNLWNAINLWSLLWLWLITPLLKNDQILLLPDVVSPSCQSISIMNCESYYILHTFYSHVSLCLSYNCSKLNFPLLRTHHIQLMEYNYRQTLVGNLRLLLTMCRNNFKPCWSLKIKKLNISFKNGKS